MNALNPTTPRSASASMSSRFSGVRPPQRAKSVQAAPWQAASFLSKLSAVRAGGDEFSGMSMKQVPPPAASAAEPRADPFPRGAARVVEMHVRIQHTGEHVQPARIDRFLRSVGHLGSKGDDPALRDPD